MSKSDAQKLEKLLEKVAKLDAKAQKTYEAKTQKPKQ